MSGEVPAGRRGRLVVLVGPSAVGKSSVVSKLRSEVPDLFFSVSATTRDPRPGEVDGRDYHFVGDQGFDRLIADGALLEWAEIHGGLQRSGTPAQPVYEALDAGRPVLVEVDLAGAASVKEALPEAVTVFLSPPTWDELERRLRGRGTESAEKIARRLETARAEMATRDDYDAVVVNDDLDRAVSDLVSLLVGPVAPSA
ncbi:guanylate kinase [Tsukamurella tyrosinosolvens]|uniref:Guanylate kinase n=1 Tax=Tsukamurella tyrosinosolvens TaxID=57704 RepID=A0A1H4X6Q8_TSUTY|nr:guanylate kinase [Tsukamurella tyrosinosolvens]QRY83781.1 guanylate kinase [Tsukamurella tyrosinosolvens]SED01235.1 guanylate kinase [Tsukamurella tyrosinosolvens]